MIIIRSIIEEDHILEFIKKRNLLNQYKKAKSNILIGHIISSGLKIRNPKKKIPCRSGLHGIFEI